MSEDTPALVCKRERLWQTRDNRYVWRITFAGVYPIGSLGNPTADQMGKFVQEVFADAFPAGVLYALKDLHYRWGDAIYSALVVSWERQRYQALGAAGFAARPTVYCFFANGETYAALQSLLGVSGLIRFSTALHESEEEALALLRKAVPPVTDI